VLREIPYSLGCAVRNSCGLGKQFLGSSRTEEEVWGERRGSQDGFKEQEKTRL
jgi:hypothetical protein